MTPPPSDAEPYSEATFYAEATRFLNGDTKGIVTAPELSRLMARIATQETATARGDNVCDACLGEPLTTGPCMCGGSGQMSEAARYLRTELVTARARIAELASLLQSSSMLLGQAADWMTLERGADTVGTNKLREMASRIDKAIAPAAETESLRAKGG